LPLQEVFGELHSPQLAWGQVSLTFELLSPARRPIQTTADLAHFWRSSYFEVIKEMKGRYPKHRWPDKPLDEKPGRSIKSRPIA
jgi:ATP-dependent helicase HrpB